MPLTGTSGSVGDLGGRPPRSTRPTIPGLAPRAGAHLLVRLREAAADQGIGGEAAGGRFDSIAARNDLSDLIEREYAQERLRGAMERVRSRVEPQTWQAFLLLNMERLSGEEAAGRLGMRLGSTYAASSKVRRLIREEVLREEPVSP
jgi:DNA-directed RNA polymerase specialized sigma24 family protein